MKIRIFAAGADGEAGGADALNQFLSAHKVIGVEKALVSQGAGAAYWTFAVTYLEGSESTGAERRDFNAAGDKTDYKQELSPEAFAMFVRLRNLRKRLATEEGVPMYMVFTNAQLAEMARAPCSTKADLRKIAGVGEARVEKYGAAFLEEMARHETSGESAGQDRGAGEPPPGVLEGVAAQT